MTDRRGTAGHALLHRFGPAIVMGGMLLALYAVARLGLEPARRFLMPSFAEMWTNAFGLSSVRGELIRRLGVTASIAMAGLATSIVVGMALGLLMFRLRALERAVMPYLVVLQSVPILAITPLLQTGLGYGTLPKVLIAFIMSFFSIPTTLLLGLRSVDRDLSDLFRLHRAGWWETLWKLSLPSALPTLFAGFRIAAGLSVIGAITGELFFQTGDGGLGQMLINAKINFDYPQVYAALIVSSLLSITVFTALGALGRRLFAPWHDSARH